MGRISPIKLQGIWDEGYALDKHIVSSTPIGEDNYGRMRYDTIRTPLGELIYQYKYRKKDCLEQIMELVEPFIKRWLSFKGIETVLPVPPTNVDRDFQPVFEIAKRVAKILNTYYYEDVLTKETKKQSKDLCTREKGKIEKGILQVKRAKIKQNVLLIDDLFQSGATLTGCVKELRKDKKINLIYVLTMTKTKGE